jgi:DNA ligase (NAD+)
MDIIGFALEDTVMKNNILYISIPDICPICGGATQIKQSASGTKELYCTNPDCQAKLINRIEHFLGKKGLDARGVSKKTLEKLIDWGWVDSLEDIFALPQHRNEWIRKPGFGIASVDKMLDSIDQSTNTTLARFISGLGIPLVGTTYAKEICKHFATWEEFIIAAKNPNYDFTAWSGFGWETHCALHRFDYSEAENIYKNYLTNKIKNDIINQEEKESLKGQTIVITGGLNHYSNRAELQQVIESLGGRCASSISSKTSMLICNDISSTSSKMVKARQLGIPILSEEEFIREYLT